MITLTAKIKLSSGGSGSLTSIVSNLSKSNVSSDIGAVLNARKRGSNPLIFGASSLGKGATFADSVDYYIGNISANSAGKFDIPYVLTITGKDINAIEILFDSYNNQYPNTIEIDGTVYNNTSYVFSTSNLANQNTHTITIDNWNTPNYPLRIQGISIPNVITINKRNLISFERNISDRSDFKLPSFGIMSSTGNIRFNDINDEIKDYAERLLLKSNLDVSIELNNTLTKKSEEIGYFKTNTWSYNNLNKEVNVSLKDDLEEWQDIFVSALLYDPRDTEAKPFSWLYEYLYGLTPPKYNMLPLEQLDSDTYNILANTYIKYPLLEADTLWNEWDKLCNACQLHIYKDNNGNTVCKNSGNNLWQL